METTRKIWRIFIYLSGMIFLAMGITLNTKAGLGASAIVSVPYSISQGTGWNFANLTLITYCVLVLAQFFIKGKNRSVLDLLQIIVSIVFTRFMDLFHNIITYQSGRLFPDLIVLFSGIILTGIGAAMTLNMKLIPNPGDGIVGSIADRTGKEMGLCKNIFDIGCVCCSLLIGLSFGNLLLGVGLGTILSMIGVGRVIAVFNRLTRQPLQKKAGLIE